MALLLAEYTMAQFISDFSSMISISESFVIDGDNVFFWSSAL